MELSRVDLNTYSTAYFAEHKQRLEDSVSYTRAVQQLTGSNEHLTEALKTEMATPKIVFESNSKNWYFYALGGSAFTVITYFIFKTFVLKN